MRTKGCLALFLVLLLALAGPACVEGSDEREGGGAPVFFLVSPSGLYKVESLGMQARLPITRAPGFETIPFRTGAPDLGFGRIILLNGDNVFTFLDLSSLIEFPLFPATLPAASGPIKMRLGWAGERAYLLTETVGGNVVITRIDLTNGLEAPLTGRLDQQGPGREDPVSFDLSYGGNQAWVLYDSGLVFAVNLILDDEPEGQVGDFGPGARDLNLMNNGTMFVGSDSGLYVQPPGEAVRQVSDLPEIIQVRIRDREATSVLAVTADNGIHEIDVANGFTKTYLQTPETPGAVISPNVSFIKPTRVFPGIVLGTPPYRIAMNNNYRIYIQDPDGPNADLTLTITPLDPAQGVFFTATGTDTVTYTDQSPVSEIDASFWGGVLPGTVTIHVTATSYDGQVSQWDNILPVTP